MAEWWTYQLSDLVLFTAQTYYRLFELYNHDIWPVQLAALISGIGILLLVWRKPSWHGRAIATLLAISWLWVSWSYLYQRFAVINWVANWYAIAFVLEAMLLIWVGTIRNQLSIMADTRVRTISGLSMVLFALFIQPFIGLLIGHSLVTSELFGITPDPTVTATFGILLMTTNKSCHVLLIIPLAWCAITGATLWALESPSALLMPAIAVATITLCVKNWKTSSL